MARPQKQNCDYFSHDGEMRNHRKIKAIRNKFGVAGYGIWCMFLEHLTKSDFNLSKTGDFEDELLAADFGVSVAEMQDVVNYCIRLELLQKNGVQISCNSLNQRLKPVYEKREAGKEAHEKAKKKYISEEETPISVTETDLSVTEIQEKKVNKSKVNNTDTNVSVFSEKQKSEFGLFESWILKKAPSLPDFKEPFTIEQYLELRTTYNKSAICNMCERMHNSNGLTKKYKSAYITLKNWIKSNGTQH